MELIVCGSRVVRTSHVTAAPPGDAKSTHFPLSPIGGRMGFMPRDPTRDLLTMQERLESLFGRATPGWVPPVDLSELHDPYILTLDLAGLSREDVQLQGDEQTLTLRGNRPTLACCPERFQQLERGQGQFSRSFRFALPVRPD